MQEKPIKKNDKEIFALLTEKISSRDYIFLLHAKKRLKDRNIIDLTVLDILEGNPAVKESGTNVKTRMWWVSRIGIIV